MVHLSGDRDTKGSRLWTDGYEEPGCTGIRAPSWKYVSRREFTPLGLGLIRGRITIRANDGEVQQNTQIGSMMYMQDFDGELILTWYRGNADINVRKNVFCIDDPAQGAALFRLQSGARVRTYPVAIKRTMRVRQVSFAEECSAIVIGSDHGTIYIFDRRSGDVIDELKMGTNGWIQTVIVCTFERN
jgi:hypothetical protein